MSVDDASTAGSRSGCALGFSRLALDAELARRAAAVRDRFVRGDDERAGRDVCFAEHARRWLASYPGQKGLKRSTREGYATIVEKHLIPVFGQKRLSEIDQADIAVYVLELGQLLSPRTINRNLNLLHLILESAQRLGVIDVNPVTAAERPRPPRLRWRILSPAEIGRVERAFRELVADAVGEERAWRQQGRALFLTVVGTGLRRGEILGLRWFDVDLDDAEGPTVRVRETWVRAGVDTPKSVAAERTIAIGPRLAHELRAHRERTGFAREGDRVFVSPKRGTPLDPMRYAATLKLALERAGIEGRVRPFHDGRHSAITNEAAAGNAPIAVMKRAGHSTFATTQLYIDLAGTAFRAEAVRLEERIFAGLPN